MFERARSTQVRPHRALARVARINHASEAAPVAERAGFGPVRVVEAVSSREEKA